VGSGQWIVGHQKLKNARATPRKGGFWLSDVFLQQISFFSNYFSAQRLPRDDFYQSIHRPSAQAAPLAERKATMYTFVHYIKSSGDCKGIFLPPPENFDWIGEKWGFRDLEIWGFGD
jgi:hypothetical protein